MVDPYAPQCPDCERSAEWIECENCDGEGARDQIGDAPIPCRPCDGEGGEWVCPECDRATDRNRRSAS